MNLKKCEHHGYFSASCCPHCQPVPTIEQSLNVPRNENNRPSQSSESQFPVHRKSMGQEAGEAGNPESIHVRVTSYRRRTIDPDNLCPKYFIDCLRYAKIIPDDTNEAITLTVRQKKVFSKEDERTEIEID